MDFLRKSKDGVGIDFEFKDFRAYIKIYSSAKRKYNLSFKNNHLDVFIECDVHF